MRPMIPRWDGAWLGRRRLGAPLLSTAFTGTTNLLLPLGVQLTAGTAATGALTLALTPLTVALAIQRNVLAQTVLRNVTRAAGLSATVIGLGGCATLASAAFVFYLRLDPVFWLSTGVTPIALLQDAFRFRSMGAGRADRAALADGAWLAVLVLGTAATVWASAAPLTLANLLSAYAAGAVLALLLGIVRRPAGPGQEGPHAAVPSLVAEGLMLAGLGTLAQPVLVFAAGLPALGILRIAQLTGALPALLLTTLQSGLLRETRLEDISHVRHTARRVVAVVGAACAFITLAVAAIPSLALAEVGLERRGSFLGTMVLVQVSTVLSAWVMVLMWSVRISAPSRQWLSMRAAASIAEFACASVLGWLVGAPGVGAGYLANNVVIASYAHAHLRRAARAEAVRYTSPIRSSQADRE